MTNYVPLAVQKSHISVAGCFVQSERVEESPHLLISNGDHHTEGLISEDASKLVLLLDWLPFKCLLLSRGRWCLTEM